MQLKKLELFQYRNIKNMKVEPCDTVNVIYGENAQGKTNLIEAIWLFTGNNSFRGSKTSELIQFNQQECSLSMEFKDEKRIQKIDLFFSNKKKIKLNGVDLKSLNELNGNFFCVVFSPSHLSFVKEGPKNRRKFIDIAISQIKPQYKNYLITYEKLLDQRNALLKSSSLYPNIREDIDIWDMQIAKIGTIISIYRNDYIKKLMILAKDIYKGLSSKREDFSLFYQSTIYEDISVVESYEDCWVNHYYQCLKDNFDYDLRQGYTTCGIHRDDLEILIDDHSVKTYGSQGQQRSCVITLKLGEAALLKKVTNENPIILLDDVMSELDEKRQDYILNHVKNMQVFITCCDFTNTIRLKEGRLFHIEKGEIIKISEVKEKEVCL